MGKSRDKKFANKEISRRLKFAAIRRLRDLHQAIFRAYNRWEEHLYEFQFGKTAIRSEKAQLRDLS